MALQMTLDDRSDHNLPLHLTQLIGRKQEMARHGPGQFLPGQ
jgi:hypothetical protein